MECAPGRGDRGQHRAIVLADAVGNRTDQAGPCLGNPQIQADVGPPADHGVERRDDLSRLHPCRHPGLDGGDRDGLAAS